MRTLTSEIEKLHKIMMSRATQNATREFQITHQFADDPADNSTRTLYGYEMEIEYPAFWAYARESVNVFKAIIVNDLEKVVIEKLPEKQEGNIK